MRPQQANIIIAKEVYKQFKCRYSNDKDFYYRKIANEIISNETAHIVALFKDYLIADDTSEFLQRYYRKDESRNKLPKIYKYYHSCSVIFPNYVMLQEAKYICKNIQRKQCLIDNQQMQEEEMERKRKQADVFEASSDTVFDTNVYDSLLNITESNSVIMRVMGVNTTIAKKANSNGSGNGNGSGKDYEEGDSIDKLIEHIETYDLIREKKELKLKQMKINLNIKKSINLNALTNRDRDSNSNRDKERERDRDLLVYYQAKKKKNCFLNSNMNNIMKTKENKSKDRIVKKEKTKIDSSGPLRTSSNILTRNQKQNIAALVSSLHSHSRQISNTTCNNNNNNTFSSPRLSSRIYYVVNRQIIPMKNNTTNNNNHNGSSTNTNTNGSNNNKVNSPIQNKFIKTIGNNSNNNNNEYVPRTSRESKSKPKLSCKLDMFDFITSKFQKNPNLSKKTLGNISTNAPSFSLKAQTHQHQHQHQHQHKKQQRSECIMSTSPIHHKTLNDNLNELNDKRQVTQQHRNTRNAILNKIHSGLFSADFSSSPWSEIFRTTTKQSTVSSNLQKRTDRVIKSFHIKGFEDMLKKKDKEKGISSNHHSHRDKVMKHQQQYQYQQQYQQQLNDNNTKVKSITKRRKDY